MRLQLNRVSGTAGMGMELEEPSIRARGVLFNSSAHVSAAHPKMEPEMALL